MSGMLKVKIECVSIPMVFCVECQRIGLERVIRSHPSFQILNPCNLREGAS